MEKFDFKLELQKALLMVLKGLMSRTFWGIAILTYLYLKGVIPTDKYQWASAMIAGGTQTPKLIEIISTIFIPKTPVALPSSVPANPTEVKE